MKGSDLMSFGDRLKEARIMKGYTQKQLAEKLNIVGTTLTGYEKDNSEPSMNTISTIMQTRIFCFKTSHAKRPKQKRNCQKKLKTLQKNTAILIHSANKQWI